MRDVIKYLLAIGVLVSGFYLAKQYQYRGGNSADGTVELAGGRSPQVDLEPSQPDGAFADPVAVAVLLDVDRMLADSPRSPAEQLADDPPDGVVGSSNLNGRPTIRQEDNDDKPGRRKQRPASKPNGREPPDQPVPGDDGGSARVPLDAGEGGRAFSEDELFQPEDRELGKAEDPTSEFCDEPADQEGWAAPPPSLKTEYEPRLNPIHDATAEDRTALEAREAEHAFDELFVDAETDSDGSDNTVSDNTVSDDAVSEGPAADRNVSNGGNRAGSRSPGGPFGQGPRVHRIAEGETLRKLAEIYLGDSSRYLEFYQANRQVLFDPRLLPIGVELTIPGTAPRPASVGP